MRASLRSRFCVAIYVYYVYYVYLHEHGADVLDRVLMGTLGAVVFLHIGFSLALVTSPGLVIDMLQWGNRRKVWVHVCCC